MPVCTAPGKVYGVQEWLLPALVGLLDQAHAVALLRCLKAEIDTGKVRKVFHQLLAAGKGLVKVLAKVPPQPTRRAEVRLLTIGVMNAVFGDPFGVRVGPHNAKRVYAELHNAARVQLDDVVGALDHVQVVLDHDAANARLASSRSKQSSKRCDVRGMQAGGRLDEQEQAARLAAGGQVAGQLEPLAFAAGERVGRLAQAQVLQADVEQPFELALEAALGAEEAERLAHRQVRAPRRCSGCGP